MCLRRAFGSNRSCQSVESGTSQLREGRYQLNLAGKRSQIRRGDVRAGLSDEVPAVKADNPLDSGRLL